MSDQTIDHLLQKTTTLERLGEDVSFLQIGKKKYMVSLVGEDVSIVDELKAYVANEITTIKGEMSDVFEKDIATQLQAQLMHIQRARQRGQVAIPDAMRDKAVTYRDGTVNEVKAFVFNPWCVKGTYSDIAGAVAGIADSRFLGDDVKGKFSRARNRDGEFQLTFKSSIYYPGLVTLTKNGLKMCNELKTFHTYTDQRLCVGNSDPKQVFRLESVALGTQLSILNRFSPLSSDIRYGNTSLTYPAWVTSTRCWDFAITRDRQRAEAEETASTAGVAVPMPAQSEVEPRPVNGWRVN